MKSILTTLLALFTLSVSAQSTSFRTFLIVPSDYNITRYDKANDILNVSTGDKIVSTYSYKKNGVVYNGEHTETATTARTETTYVVKPVNLGSMPGRASIEVDKTDPSIINVNYWFDRPHTVKSGTKMIISKNYWKNSSDSQMSSESVESTFPNDTTFNGIIIDAELDNNTYRIPTEIQNQPWCKYSPLIITVYNRKDFTKVDYYIIKKNIKDVRYTMQLQNRDYIHFRSFSYDLGAITIPFKIRSGYTRNNVTAHQEIASDFNVALYGGISYGRDRYRYETGSLKSLPTVKVTLGAFIGIGKQDIDTLATSTAELPLIKGQTRSLLIVSTGVGVLVSFADVKLGWFIGIDTGMGVDANKWNQNARIWNGIGLGYNLAGLWGKKS
jgi:hypothetical protein